MTPINDPETSSSTRSSPLGPFKGGAEPSKVGGQLCSIVSLVQAIRSLIGLEPAPPPSQASASAPATLPSTTEAVSGVGSAPRSEASSGTESVDGSSSADRSAIAGLRAELGRMAEHMSGALRELNGRMNRLDQARSDSEIPSLSGENSMQPGGAGDERQQVQLHLVGVCLCLVTGVWGFSSTWHC